MGVETFPILDDVVLPPAKGRAARPRKSDVDPIQKEKRVSLPKSTRFDNVSDGLRGLFSTPSLMKGEDPHVYAELYRRVEEVVQPQDVWDQMMVYDITNHFWEQHRYRRCTGSVINCKRRAALEKILREGIGLNDVDTKPLPTLTSKSQGSRKGRSSIMPPRYKFQKRGPASSI